MSDLLSCYFPTTVVLVDDDPAFLGLLRSKLNGAGFICKGFLDAREALDFINDSAYSNRLDYSNLIRTGEEGTSDWKSILLNVNVLHSEIYSSGRFNKISTVISDYQMPNMNGVEFCSKIFDVGIQKILLTGVVEDKIGIDAFNGGYISRFFRKNLSFDIVGAVKDSMSRYFQIYTNLILQHASSTEFVHLKDPVFFDFFSRLYARGDYIEYYMLDPYGSYLMVRANGSCRMLSVLTEIEAARLMDVAIESGEADDDTLGRLQSREYMLVYHNRNASLPPVSEWHKYLRPANVIDGYQTYYYSFLEEDKPDLDYDEIVSLDSFLRNSAT